MTTITDNFNRANNPISLGSSSEGWSWTAVDGVWGILSNSAIQTVAAANDAARAEISLATSNHYAQLTIVSFATNSLSVGGPCTRFSSSAKTFYVFLWRSTTTQYQLFKSVAGVFTQIGTGGSVKADGDVIRLSSDSNNQHIGYRNGAINMAAVTDTSITTNTRTGMVMNPNIGQPNYDDFIASDLSSGSLPYILGTGMVQSGTTILNQGTSPKLWKGTVQDNLNVIPS